MHLVFDLDGTLIDSRPGIQAAVETAIQSVYHHLDVSQLQITIGPRIRDILRAAIKQASTSEIITMEAAFRAAYDREEWKKTIVYPGVEKTLKELLKRGHDLYIFTNKPKLPTTCILKYLELSDYFSGVTSSDSCQPAFTSKASMLNHLMATCALLYDNTACIGDSEDDFLAAQECKVQFIGIEYGYGILPTKEKSRKSLKSFPEILLAL